MSEHAHDHNQSGAQHVHAGCACPCGSEKNYEKCCEPYHKGKKTAETAESLLKSRYCAFVAGEVDYVIDTHHPETVPQVDRASIAEWASQSEWFGLTVHKIEQGGKDDETGIIDFTARYSDPRAKSGHVVSHTERAEFRKKDGRWYFYDALKNQPIKNEQPLPGRNDPCSCGSGKKYKKCCAV